MFNNFINRIKLFEEFSSEYNWFATEDGFLVERILCEKQSNFLEGNIFVDPDHDRIAQFYLLERRS